MKTKPKFEFTATERMLAAFGGNIKLKLQEYIEDLPVFFLYSGSKWFRFSKKFDRLEETTESVTEHTPRFVMTLGALSHQEDKNSYQRNTYKYLHENTAYECMARRSTLNIPIECDFNVPDVLCMLQGYEIILSMMAKENVFSYSSGNNNFKAMYLIESPTTEMREGDHDGTPLNCHVKFTTQLIGGIFSPRIETIRNMDEPSETKISLTAKQEDIFTDSDSDHTEIIDTSNTDNDD